jgi:hypothetical protein
MAVTGLSGQRSQPAIMSIRPTAFHSDIFSHVKNEVSSSTLEGSVRKFLHDHVDPGVFAPDAVRTLIAAFDGAWQSITASGARLSGQQSEVTRELLARYIIEQARQGELDQCRLRDGALLHLAQSNLRRPPREQK